MNPTYIDHHYLNFWLWATLRDAGAYLQAEENLTAIFRGAERDPMTLTGKLTPARSELDLNRYHFVMTLGRLADFLFKNAVLFPEIDDAYKAAVHLQKEARTLRNHYEHG